MEELDRRVRVWQHVRHLILQGRDTPEKKAARLARCLRRQEEILRRHYKASPQYADQEFITRYAAKYTTKLLQERKQIQEQYLKFFRRRMLVEYLERHASKLLVSVTWRIAALQVAERLDVEPPPPPPEPPLPPLPRRKPTIEEIRALKLRRQAAVIGDKIALRKNKIEAILQVRKEMDQYDLDPDERQRVESELIEDILEEETTNAAGKEVI